VTTSALNGLFRGICVDNRDPLNLGRIRVQVPQILGTATSGWAFPAWSIHEKTVWPRDRLPKTGGGVWVMFDSTSPDKMIWLAAFGALDLINQPGFAPDIDFISAIDINMSGTPEWNKLLVFYGTLSSDGGVPNPRPEVLLEASTDGEATWTTVASTPVIDPSTGAWSISYTVNLPGAVDYRVRFPGVGVYGPATSVTISTDTTVLTNLTLSLAGTPQWNANSTFSGVLSSDAGVPTSPTVSLQSKPSGGSWTTVASTTSVNQSTGAWSIIYKVATPGAVDYRAVYAGTGPYEPATSNTVVTNTTVTTTTSTPNPPTLYNGTGFTVTGSVTASTGTVTGGTVALWWRYTIGGDTSWKKSGGEVAVTNGAYSLTQGALSLLGATEWQVRYTGYGAILSSNSAAKAATVYLRPNAALTKGTVTHTSVAFSWAATVGATHYNIDYQINGGAWTRLSGGTQIDYRSLVIQPLTNDTTYSFRVQPTAQDVSGTWQTGGWSSTITASTGHPQQTDSGSTGWITLSCEKYDSHRIDTGWSSVTDMRQGYYSSSYGGEGYIGIARYTGTRVRDAIIAECGGGSLGSARQANGDCSAAEISMARGNASGASASGGPVGVAFYTTTSTGTGDRPVREGSKQERDSPSANSAAVWYDFGTGHGQRLGDAEVNSVCIYKNNSADYAQFTPGNVRLKWSWNYTSVAYVAPSWS